MVHTSTGTAVKISAALRPNLSENHPKNVLPINPPIHIRDVTHDTSLTVNGPDSNGVSSEVRTSMAADGQPQTVPYPIDIMFPISESQRNKIKHFNWSSTTENIADYINYHIMLLGTGT